MAYARAVALDLYGGNLRFVGELNPAYATAEGMLPRWEKILAQPPIPGDPQSVRRARCAAALTRFGRKNSYQAVVDVLVATVGALFDRLTLTTPATALVWWPPYGGSAAIVSSVTGNLVTVSGLTAVPVSAAGAQLVLSNCATAGNNSPPAGFLVHKRLSTSSVQVVNNGSPGSPDYGAGGSPSAPTIQWSMPNPSSPFTSSIAHVLVRLNPHAVPGMLNADGSLSGRFFVLANQINPVLDLMLPADVTFDWYVLDSGGGFGFLLDDPNNLDTEVMLAE
jgi:hypothetical protein